MTHSDSNKNHGKYEHSRLSDAQVVDMGLQRIMHSSDVKRLLDDHSGHWLHCAVRIRDPDGYRSPHSNVVSIFNPEASGELARLL